FMGHLYELEDLEQEAFLYAATHADRVRAWYKDGGERLAARRIRSAVFESNKAHVRNWEQAELGGEALTECVPTTIRVIMLKSSLTCCGTRTGPTVLDDTPTRLTGA